MNLTPQLAQQAHIVEHGLEQTDDHPLTSTYRLAGKACNQGLAKDCIRLILLSYIIKITSNFQKSVDKRDKLDLQYYLSFYKNKIRKNKKCRLLLKLVKSDCSACLAW